MSSLLDVIFAIVLGSTIMLIIANASLIATTSATTYSEEQMIQRLLVETTQALEGDFRNMGYGVPSDTTIIAARDTAITFLSDYDNNGVVDTITYYLGPIHETGYQNDSIRLIHRMVGSTVQSIGMCTKFRLKYFIQDEADTLDTPVNSSLLGMIKLIEITLEVQSPYGLYVKTGNRNAFFATTMWRQTRLASQNLKRSYD